MIIVHAAATHKSNLIAITIFYNFIYYYVLQNCTALYVSILDIDPQ